MKTSLKYLNSLNPISKKGTKFEADKIAYWHLVPKKSQVALLIKK